MAGVGQSDAATLSLPYVFVIDIDGTMVGRVDFQSQQYILHSVLKQSGFKPIKQHKIPPAFYANAKLVRSGLASFMRNIQKQYANNVYFFVYTGSEKTWAYQEIAWIEETHGVKFMRPIFTRDDCVIDALGNVRKSINKVWPRITRTFSPSIPAKDRSVVLEHHLLIIDNNAVYLDHMDKLLLCPDYGYLHFENLLHGIPPDARNHPNVDKLILSFISQGILCPYIETSAGEKSRAQKAHGSVSGSDIDSMRKLASQYTWLASKCKSIADVNEKYVHDKFWSNLRKLIIENNIRKYTPSIIVNLQSAVWRKAAT